VQRNHSIAHCRGEGLKDGYPTLMGLGGGHADGMGALSVHRVDVCEMMCKRKRGAEVRMVGKRGSRRQ